METDIKLIEELESLYAAVVCDILDELGYRRQVLPSRIRPLTGPAKLAGRVFTAHARVVDAAPDEPYKLEIEAVDSLREGDVMVTDAGDNVDCGFWGELLTTASLARKARGTVMNACTRDVWKLAEMGFPVFGIGYNAADSKGRLDIDSLREPIEIGGVCIRQDDYIIGDRDGVVAIPREAIVEVIKLGREKVSGENTVRAELERGDRLGDVFKRHGIL